MQFHISYITKYTSGRKWAYFVCAKPWCCPYPFDWCVLLMMRCCLCYRDMDATEWHWGSGTHTHTHTHTHSWTWFPSALGWIGIPISHGRSTATWIWSPMLKNQRLAKGWKVEIRRYSPQTSLILCIFYYYFCIFLLLFRFPSFSNSFTRILI